MQRSVVGPTVRNRVYSCQKKRYSHIYLHQNAQTPAVVPTTKSGAFTINRIRRLLKDGLAKNAALTTPKGSDQGSRRAAGGLRTVTLFCAAFHHAVSHSHTIQWCSSCAKADTLAKILKCFSFSALPAETRRTLGQAKWRFLAATSNPVRLTSRPPGGSAEKRLASTSTNQVRS